MRITAALSLGACLSSPAFPQDRPGMDEAYYKKMLDQAMKSGGYSQSLAQSWDARLRVISGSVLVKPPDSEEWSKITGEIPLNPDDQVKTGTDGVAELYLDDSGAFLLGRSTELDVKSLAQENTVLSLGAGSVAAKMKPSLNEKHKLTVRTYSSACDVSGAEFAVEHSALSMESAAGVFAAGAVVVTQADASGKPGQQFRLEKNTEIVVSPTMKRLKPVPLFRMGRYRGAIGKMRKRLAAMKGWTPRSPEKRAELRDIALKRKVVRKQIKKPRKGPARRRSPGGTR